MIPVATNTEYMSRDWSNIGHERREVRVDIVHALEGRDDADIAVWADDDDGAPLLVDAVRLVPPSPHARVHVRVVEQHPASTVSVAGLGMSMETDLLRPVRPEQPREIYARREKTNQCCCALYYLVAAGAHLYSL